MGRMSDALFPSVLPAIVSVLSLIVSVLSFRRAGRWNPAPWVVLTETDGPLLPFPEDGNRLRPVSVFQVENMGDGAILELRAFSHECRIRLFAHERNAMRPVDYVTDGMLGRTPIYAAVWPVDYMSDSVGRDALLVFHWYESPARLSRCRCHCFPMPTDMSVDCRLRERRLFPRLTARMRDLKWHYRYHHWRETDMIHDFEHDIPPFIYPAGDPLPNRPRRLK